MADFREAHASLALDVNTLIFDHLLYNATRQLLGNNKYLHGNNGDTQDQLPFDITNSLQMVDSFLEIFKASHEDLIISHTLRFRLLLLRFTTLFKLRHSRNFTTPSVSSLERLRLANRERAIAWGCRINLPVVFPKQVLHWYQNFQPVSNHEQYDPNRVALLDVLPSFVELSAARNDDAEMGTTQRWLDLAAEMMLQATVEQYLFRGQGGTLPLREAFAWGMEPLIADANEWDENEMDIDNEKLPQQNLVNAQHQGEQIDVNNIFRTADDDEEDECSMSQKSALKANNFQSVWSLKRTQYINALLPQNSGTRDARATQAQILHHLQALQERYPLAAFEDAMNAFLAALCDSYAPPILTQLEREDELEVDGVKLDESNQDAKTLRALAKGGPL